MEELEIKEEIERKEYELKKLREELKVCRKEKSYKERCDNLVNMVNHKYFIGKGLGSNRDKYIYVTDAELYSFSLNEVSIKFVTVYMSTDGIYETYYDDRGTRVTLTSKGEFSTYGDKYSPTSEKEFFEKYKKCVKKIESKLSIENLENL